MVAHQPIGPKNKFKDAQRASEPILSELSQLGVKIESLSELINTTIDYRAAIPVLIDWLPRVDNMAVKTSLVRALTTKWAKPEAAIPLINEFRKLPESEEFGLKWIIGNALSEVADDNVFDEIVELVQDKSHGRAREMLAVALANMKDPQTVNILISLLNDDQIAGHAVIALRKLAPPEARRAIEPFVHHPTTWIRNEAKRALKKIDKKVDANRA